MSTYCLSLFQETARVYGSFILIFVVNIVVLVSTAVFQMDLVCGNDKTLRLIKYFN